MGVLCNLASVSTSQVVLRTSLASSNFQLPVRLCAASMKYSATQVARMSVLSFSQNCVRLQPTRMLWQCGPFKVHKCFAHSQLLHRSEGLPGATQGVLRRVRGASWNNVLGHRLIGMDSRSKDTYHRRTGLIYVCAAGIFMLGMSYAGVPLYRMFCQATGLGGTISRGHDTSKIETMQAVPERSIKIRFNADVASSMRWNFKPQQTEVKVLPGETALAFYTAKNPTDKPIIGISTYNVVPFEAGQYFNKIQCFCFEEQRLNPHEQVDMPVFFYIDPEFAEDPKLQGVETITLSYTFFEAKEGFQVPLPGYMTQAQ